MRKKRKKRVLHFTPTNAHFDVIVACVNAFAPGGPVARLAEAGWDAVTDAERHLPAGPVADRIALRLRAALAPIDKLLEGK